MDAGILAYSKDKLRLALKVAKYSRIYFIIATLLICVGIPFWKRLSITHRFFKLSHHIRHHILRKRAWIHKSWFYHNQSFHTCLFWFTLTTIATTYGSNGDLKEITKRMGRVAVALMPPLLFLTQRPSPLPHTLYLTLLPIHKWISRIVVLFALLHSGLYIWYMSVSNGLFKLKKLANIYGIIAMGLFLLIAITSLRQVRRKNFRLFYYVHYISTWLVVVLIYYHARPGVPYYTALNVLILSSQIIYRVYHTSIARVSIVKVSQSLTIMEIPKESIVRKPVLPAGHVRISIYHNNFLKRWFFKLIPFQHPFTVATLPTEDPVKLIIRNGQFPLIPNGKYYITGIYEPMIPFITKPKMPSFTPDPDNPFHINTATLLHSPLSYKIDARRVLMVVGGSAISLALPLLRILNFNGVNVRLIWVSRDIRDLQVLNHFKNNFEGLEIYVSGCGDNDQDIQIDYVDSHPELDEEDEDLTRTPSSSELQQNDGLTTVIGSSSLIQNSSNSGNNNYGSIPNKKSFTAVSNVRNKKSFSSLNVIDSKDEVDFTQMYSAKLLKKSKSQLQEESPLSKVDAFRKPSIIEPLTVPNCNDCGISLGDEESYCCLFNESDKKLRIPSGIKVFFGRPTLNQNDYKWCLQRECIGPSENNKCCNPNNKNITHVDDLSQVWVMAAGPRSLIENAKRWATDGGLHFYAESFAV